MIEIKGNIWDYQTKPDYAIAITTNGTIKKDGKAVMGAGVAKQAMEQWPDIPFTLGKSLEIAGNNLHYLGNNILSFPVKHNWWEKADIVLIERSAKQLMDFINNCHKEVEFAHIKKIVLVRPGCGNGKLKWEDVKPVLEKILDDRIEIIDYV
jgi:hypothetical protein